MDKAKWTLGRLICAGTFLSTSTVNGAIVALPAAMDSYVAENAGSRDHSHGNASRLRSIGVINWRAIVLMAFDLSGLGAGRVTSDATLTLTKIGEDENASGNLAVRPILKQWNEDVTWQGFWPAEFGAALDIQAVHWGGVFQPATWRIPRDVIETWRTGTSNYGVALTNDQFVGQLDLEFGSKEGGQPPLLSFNFSPLADYNLDDKVDGADLSRWARDFGESAGSDSDGDLDSDGSDFLAWQRGFSGSASQVTPEPSAAVLVLMGTLLWSLWRSQLGRTGR